MWFIYVIKWPVFEKDRISPHVISLNNIKILINYLDSMALGGKRS